jgi:hypothetical protein
VSPVPSEPSAVGSGLSGILGLLVGVMSAAVAVGGRKITSMTERIVSGDLVPAGQSLSPADMSLLAEQLVASATEQGVHLTGSDGLLTALTRQVLQAALEVEMADHLGFDRGDPVGRGASNIATVRPLRRFAPRSVRSVSTCLGIGLARSNHRSCRSISVGSRGSTRLSFPFMRKG